MKKTDTFLRFINTFAAKPLLSKEEELELARRYKEGDVTAGNKLVTANMRFLVSLANRFGSCRQGTTHEDVFQEGCVGFLHAIRRFDASRGYRFTTYGAWWAQAYIGRYLERSSVVVMPRGQARINSEYFEKSTVNYDGDSDSFSVQLASDQPNAYDEYLEKQLHHLVRLQIKKMHPRDREIIQQRFFEDMTLDEVGKRWGITRERVRQIEARILPRMRLNLLRHDVAPM